MVRIGRGMGMVGARRRAVAAVACLASCLALASVVLASAASSPPSINGVYSTSVTLSSAQLVGYVNPRGLTTSYSFQYGPTTAYGWQTPSNAAGTGTSEVKVSAELTGLAAGTVYHFRLVATSSAGTTTGADHVLTTTKIPLSLQVEAVPSQVIFGNPFSIQGVLTGTGSADHEVELQMNPYPYVEGMKTLGNPIATDAGGHFSFPVASLLASARFRVVAVGPPVVTSPVIFEGVAVRVTLHARRIHRNRRNRRGELFRLYGTIAPADVGGRVGFQLIRPGSPSVNEGGTRVKHGSSTVSRFSGVVRIRRRGLYEAFVTVVNGSHVAGYSAPVRIR